MFIKAHVGMSRGLALWTGIKDGIFMFAKGYTMRQSHTGDWGKMQDGRCVWMKTRCLV